MTRIITTIAAALSVATLLASAGSVQAKTVTFGTRLDHEPSNSLPAHNCLEDGSEDPTPACTRVAINQGNAPGGRLRAPANGTIVKFRVRAGGPGVITFRLAKLGSSASTPRSATTAASAAAPAPARPSWSRGTGSTRRATR